MTDMTRDEALAHFGVRGMRWGVRKSPEKSSYKVDLVPETPAPQSDRPVKVYRPSVAKPLMLFGAAVVATTVIGIGAAYASQRMNVDGHLKLSQFPKLPKLPKKTKLINDPKLIKVTAERVFPFTGKAITGGPKAIESLRLVKPKRSVYDIVSDKNLKRGASFVRSGKQFTEEVLIGNIGGISINDLKK